MYLSKENPPILGDIHQSAVSRPILCVNGLACVLWQVWALSFHTPEPPPGRSASLPALPTTARLSFRNGSYGGTAKHPRVSHRAEG